MSIISQKQEQNLPSAERSLRASLIPEAAGRGSKPQRCSKQKHLSQPSSRGPPSGISGPAFRASAQQEAPQGNFLWAAATKTSRAQDCPITRQGSETPL